MTDAPDNAGEPDAPPSVPGAEAIRSAEVDKAGRLVVQLDGRDEPLVDARVARCFPWSMPGRHVCVLDADGKEAAMLESLETLDPAVRELFEEHLAERIFNPVIRNVVKHRREFGVLEMTAETDRGQVTFQVRGRDDVRVLTDRRALFRDADGNVYELPDVTALDPASRKRLEQYF